ERFFNLIPPFGFLQSLTIRPRQRRSRDIGANETILRRREQQSVRRVADPVPDDPCIALPPSQLVENILGPNKGSRLVSAWRWRGEMERRPQLLQRLGEIRVPHLQFNFCSGSRRTHTRRAGVVGRRVMS